MKCKQGDLARILYSMRPENQGRIVKVKEYIGKFQPNEEFSFRGIVCRCLVHDHYWWVEADDLSTLIGVSPQAYIPDSWLQPIKPDQAHLSSKQSHEIEA